MLALVVFAAISPKSSTVDLAAFLASALRSINAPDSVAPEDSFVALSHITFFALSRAMRASYLLVGLLANMSPVKGLTTYHH
jgi:hypothetical protein